MSAVAIAAVCGTVVLLASRRAKPRPATRQRVDARVIRLPLPAIVPSEPTRFDRIELLLSDLVSDDPRPRSLYRIQWDDTPKGVADRALAHAGPHTDRDVLEYIHVFSAGSYNLGQFGTPATSRTYPQRMLVPGLGLGLRVAFLPRNQDALEQMLTGQMPRIVVDPRTGKPASPHTSYGLIWLPAVDPDALALGEVTCSGYEWPDGSSALDPDPKLLELLQEAA